MRLVICGGGTGGHAFPALRIGCAADSLGHSVLYVGSYRGVENRLVGDLPFAFDRVHAEPVGRPFTPKGIRGLVRLLKAQKEALRILEAFKPDVVFGTGGYASAPVLMAQRKMRGPYVLHEQNAVAGRANRVMARHAYAVCVAFAAAAKQFRHPRVLVTGMPLREEAINCDLSVEDARASFGLKPHVWTVLVYGGSQGAQALNEVVLSTVKFMSSESVQWLHVTGEKHLDAVRSSAERTALNGNYVPVGFLEGFRVGTAFRSANMAVVRCGSGTLNEVLAWGLPSLMVPLPTAAANHQLENARVLAEAGAGVLIPQHKLTPAILAEQIERWRLSANERAAAAEAAKRLYVPHACATIVALLEEAAAVASAYRNRSLMGHRKAS